MSARPTLFIALDGPILTYGNGHVDAEGHTVAPYAKTFLHWAKSHFNVCLLTEGALRDAFHVASSLGLPKDAVSVKGVMDSKVDAVQNHPNFYWLDSALIPDEINWLSQHGKTDRFMPVHPTQGVTSEHKKYLETKIPRR